MKETKTVRQVWFNELGFFPESIVNRIKERMEGKTFLEFHVISSSLSGNQTIGVEVCADRTDDEVRSMFLWEALAIVGEKEVA